MPTGIIFFLRSDTIIKIMHYLISRFMNSTIHSSFVVPVGWCFLLLAFPLLILSVAAHSLLLWSLVLRSLLHRWSSSSRGDCIGTYPYPYCFPPFGHGFGHDKMKDGMTWLILVSTTGRNLWEVPIATAFWIYSRTSSGEGEDPGNNILYNPNVHRPVNRIVVKKKRPIPR